MAHPQARRRLQLRRPWRRAASITTIIVAHRPSILANVDKILVLKQGAVEAIGPREEILSRFSTAPRRIEGGAA